jgi:hypothetical protein
MIILKLLVTVFFGFALAIVVWSRLKNPIYGKAAEIGSVLIITSLFMMAMMYLWGVISL